jgi:ADP-ribose pyrophosphatase YjhB (NUDIX family)
MYNNQYNNQFKNVSCVNCGERGHIVKECKRPITSFGIIAFKRVNNIEDENDDLNDELSDIVNSYFIDKENYSKIKFLMIQRKDTMGFIDFVRGKYPDNKEERDKKIKTCFNEMTFSEKKMLKEYDFDSIWSYIWINKQSRVFLNEYKKSKEKFNNLDINYYLQQSTKTFLHTEVGFPKGRRNMRETNITCAEREFTEETGFTKEHYDFVENYPIIEESFMGTNNVEYKHLYYLVKMKNTAPAPKINILDKLQIGEVRNIGWFSLNECLALIRSYDIEKKKIIKKIHSDLINTKQLKYSNYYKPYTQYIKKDTVLFPPLIETQPITIPKSRNQKFSYKDALQNTKEENVFKTNYSLPLSKSI